MELETSRLIVRPITMEEATTVAIRITEKISRWTAPIPWPYTSMDARNWVRNTEDAKRLGIFLKPELILIGATSMPTVNGDEAGVWINEKYEGCGFATEAVDAVIAYAFMRNGLDLLESWVHRDNAASRRVHEKLGYSLSAVTEKFWPNKDAMVPVVVYRMTRSAWLLREG
ncbi:MAG: GNAT family N-acetyltransferase [Capsulimonadaceae bacterium]|nr:GNAT family N-acetyltransferase [Capsulimonadaceae bacterium]